MTKNDRYTIAINTVHVPGISHSKVREHVRGVIIEAFAPDLEMKEFEELYLGIGHDENYPKWEKWAMEGRTEEELLLIIIKLGWTAEYCIFDKVINNEQKL